MVNIVTGKINSGKTTFCLTNYLDHGEGDGIISLKTMKESSVLHYTALHLKTQKEVLLIDKFPKEEVIYQIGPYSMLTSGYQFVKEQIGSMIDNHVSPIYLDEIGMLELEGLGFSNLLKVLLTLDIDIYITVRSDLVEPVIKYFSIQKYHIIHV